MYQHYVVKKGREWIPFCGPDAQQQAFELVGNELAIWAMTRDLAAELRLLDPQAEGQLREVALEAEVLIQASGKRRRSVPQ